ncbi:acyl carrier protein [uncultured Roseibium sp.]|uniref:acyl carrier protein n=1 Tax=uncultured Roseibium sp. TaxID=1936171 RepID=UPI0032173242
MSNTSLADSVLNFVRSELSRRLKLPVDQIASSSQFIHRGLQSVDAVIMRGEVEDHCQIELDPSALFQLETGGGFVDEVVRRHAD